MPRTCLSCGQVHSGRACNEPSTPEPIDTAAPGVNGYVQAGFDWQQAPADKPLTVEEAVEAVREPVQAVEEIPLHQVVAEALEDPDTLVILNVGLAGTRLLGMLEQFGYPLQRYVMPWAGEAGESPELGILRPEGWDEVELQALIEICQAPGTPQQRLDRLWHPRLVVMHDALPMPDLSPEVQVFAYKLGARWLMNVIWQWAHTGVYPEQTEQDGRDLVDAEIQRMTEIARRRGQAA